MFEKNQYHALSKSPAQLLSAVYGWMAAGLMISGISALATLSIPSLFIFVYKMPFVFFGLLLLQIGLAVVLSAALEKLSFVGALSIFLSYAAITGVTLSSLMLVYTASSVVSTFVVTSLMFGVMALYGHFTKADLSGIGYICTMLLFGMIIAMLVNLFLQSEVTDLFISAVGVVIFTLFIAADAQSIKYFMSQQINDDVMANKIAIIGALKLYLDFINLFIYLLRFLGKKRE